ncbi:Protein LOC339766 [Pteropus alecto]|uniref:Protein LOC339766 n=1 Tax=Pteropus alecto TaxID=9402 RepID=L5KSC5_PTEAL|nr:Protein LOC339766 [Pteropus alecto]
MAEAAIDSNEDLSEETEDPEPLEPDDGGTFQQVTNLLNIMDSESAKTDTVGAGPDMRKTLASVIITEKATAKPCVVMNALIRCLQVPKIPTQRTVSIYGILQEIIQQEGELEEQCVQRLVAIASKDMREILEMEGYMKAEVASDTLVALSRNHFSLVMYELQHHLKPLDLTDEFVIITLAKLAHGNVFEFMPYMGITLATIFTMLRLANEAKMRQVICAEPRMTARTIYLAIRVVKNTLSDTRSKVRMAILRIIGQLALSGFQDKIKGWGLKYVSVQLTLSTYKLTNRRESFYQRDLEEKMVHKVTMDTVRIITSSVSGMTNEFWVGLLCYIMETDYTEALTPICIGLTNLAERQLHASELEASTASKHKHGGQHPCAGWRDWAVDLPAPQKLLARLLVLMSSPYKGEGRGIAMLNLLSTLSHSIAPAMADTGELEIPLLVKYWKVRRPGVHPEPTALSVYGLGC